MLENFIYIKQKDLFIDLLEAGNVLDEAIVFIEDTREIWNHGTYFDGNAVDLSDVEKSIQDILDNIPTKTSDLENDSGFITGETLTQFQNTLMSGPIQSINNKTIGLENNKADKTELPTKVSDLENDSNYITETKLSDTFDSKLFIGTLEEYNILNSENKIGVGALVIILDQDDLENNNSNTATTSILGTAVIGKMILGNK